MKTQKQKSIFLIINRSAGTKAARGVTEKVVPYLKKKGCQVEYAYSEKPGHSALLARQAVQKGFSLVVVAGGDGTINEVARGLIGSKTPLGIIPTGSGNGLARELHIPLGKIKAAQVLLSGNDFEIDVFDIQQEIFLCTSGLGFDAQIARRMTLQNCRGLWKYIQLVIREIWHYKPIELEILVNGQAEKRKVFMLTFANASQFGNNAYIAPGASPSDGWMDVVLVKPFPVIHYFLFGIALFTRKINLLPFIERFRVSECKILSGNAKFFHFDGDLGHIAFPVTITLDTRKMLIRIPSQTNR